MTSADAGPFQALRISSARRGNQRMRLQTLNTVIADYEARIEKVRKAAAPPPKDLSPQDRRTLNDIQIRQVNSEILALRRQADTALVEIIKALQQAARDAKMMGERHWDFWSVLRRTKTGAGDVAGLLEAANL
jgi:phage tail tape-measure protein